MTKDNILSIFIDESGDFGQFDPKHPMYYVAMVMHEQTNDISSNIATLDTLISNWGYPNHAIHTGPLIRKEGVYPMIYVKTENPYSMHCTTLPDN